MSYELDKHITIELSPGNTLQLEASSEFYQCVARHFETTVNYVTTDNIKEFITLALKKELNQLNK